MDSRSLIEVYKQVYGDEIAKRLAAGEDVDPADLDGHTALTLMLGYRDAVIAKRLIEKGVDINRPNKNGNKPLYLAVAYGLSDVFDQLMKAKADIHHVNNSGDTALICAAGRWRIGMVEQLINQGANVNHQNQDGDTPLMSAAKFGCIGSFNLLMNAKAEINHVNNEGKTALSLASVSREVTMVEQLLAEGADINHPDNNGSTPLILAAGNGSETIIHQLIEKKADINHVNLRGVTALSAAVNYLLWIKNNIPAVKRQLRDRVEFILNHLPLIDISEDQLTAWMGVINQSTKKFKGDAYKEVRVAYESMLTSCLRRQTDLILSNPTAEKLERSLDNLNRISREIEVIQSNTTKIFQNEKTSMTEIKSLIKQVNNAILEMERQRSLGDSRICKAILRLFESHDAPVTSFEAKLDELIPRLVEPSDKELEYVREIIVGLRVDQRKLLKESLKNKLGKVGFKYSQDLIDEDRWILKLHENHSNKKKLPFDVILRVSADGKKQDYSTSTWEYFTRVMATAMFNQNPGKTPLRDHSLFARENGRASQCDNGYSEIYGL